MKRKNIILFFIIFLLSGLSFSKNSMSLEQSGKVAVIESSITPPIDPENPIEGGDAIDTPSTTGLLRIDYVSSLNFGSHSVKSDSRDFQALAQLYKSNPRPHYIQITSSGSYKGGWSLQLKQEYQFRQPNDTSNELTGAILSFSNSWLNSIDQTYPPTLSNIPLVLTNIGDVYDIAHANAGEGKGTWLINFGASSANVDGQAETIEPISDSQQHSKETNYKNKAVTLNIPKNTAIYSGDYETKLTWMLSSLP